MVLIHFTMNNAIISSKIGVVTKNELSCNLEFSRHNYYAVHTRDSQFVHIEHWRVISSGLSKSRILLVVRSVRGCGDSAMPLSSFITYQVN